MLTSQGFVTEAAPADSPSFADSQIVPHSIEAEKALLGALLIDPDQMIEVSYLKRNDFYLGAYGYIYEAILSLFNTHGNYDILTLSAYLESSEHLESVGGPACLAELVNATPTSYGAPEYAAIIYRHSISRQVIIKVTKAAQMAFNPVQARTGDMLVNEVISSLVEIDATRNVSNGPRAVSSGVEASLDSLEQIDQHGLVSGLETGIKTLDFILGGLQDKQFYLLAGRPGMGKSALALQIAYNVAKRGSAILYFSLEMSEKEMSDRLISSLCGVPYAHFKRPGFSDKWSDIIDAAGKIARLPIFIDDTGQLTVANMRSITQKLAFDNPIGLVIVDHLGLAKPSRPMKDSYHEVSDVSHSLMALSKQLDLPVLALCQLSRSCENRNDKRPKPSDLRDTGKLEEDADGILSIYRDEVYVADTEFPHLGEIGVLKNRGGDVGTATVYVNMPTNVFTDLEIREQAL